MDELMEQMQNTDINPEKDLITNFDSLYKNWGKLNNQEERRKTTLAIQKKNRNLKLDASRGILELVNSVENYDSYHPTKYRPTIHVAGFTRASVTYRNVLMGSEWLIEKPEDFETNWVVVPCPKGVRTLVVAYQGTTRFYNKHGLFKMACCTALPCGNPQEYHREHCVVLDCFHVENLNKVFILDILAWKNLPMTDGETEFRHYWLKNQMDEIPELKRLTKKNKVIFELLPKVPCSPESFNQFMMKLPHFENSLPALDGLLFYHQNAHYISGETPLVGWLYPYMVNEVLGSEITVHPDHMLKRPPYYVNQAEFIQKFEAKHNRRRRLPRDQQDTMDTSSDCEQPQEENGIPRKNALIARALLNEARTNAEVKTEISPGDSTEMDPQKTETMFDGKSYSFAVEEKNGTPDIVPTETNENTAMDADKHTI